ncbi:hypothetical protein CYMTET_19307 [Cymbomonas tetramitiformis]|uniref:Uncharacterized protein n=1 Tax=Cymbomonas tetramitiformis TaxID=36881 RepID=A0AAE0G6B9_9CHLO|nr:hypothetical protein CYMTET_19307 [Cymbomonas tetramitiformis]
MKLHKWESRWDVPSLNPACSQVEAYLRFSGASFTVSERNTPYTSPTGVLPYLELEDNGVEDDNPSNSLMDGTAAASAIIRYLKKEKGLDLDTSLSPVEAAELEAFTVLAETKLAPASAYFTWVDYENYKKHTQGAYGESLPVILNHYVPWRWRSAITTSMHGKSAPQVLEDVALVYKAIAARLGTQKFFFGNRVTSLDALLFAHLSFHQRAPMAADHLRPIMDKFPELGRYVDGILKEHFSCPLPAPPSFAAPSTSGTSSEPAVFSLQRWSSATS